MDGSKAERNGMKKDVSAAEEAREKKEVKREIIKEVNREVKKEIRIEEIGKEVIKEAEKQSCKEEIRKEVNKEAEKEISKEGQKGIDTFEIFEELFEKEEQSAPPSRERAAALPMPLGEDFFYEIEYDSGPFPGVGKYVLKSSKIEAPYREQRDEIRERFDRMREIAREARTLYFNSSKFYDRRVQQENSRIFYKQGLFMEDFEDEFEKFVPYSAYYPGYQNMGYEQLRTYFTWRTKIRQGNLEGASLSYAFLYIYELLNNIGVKDPEEGLDRLMVFRDAFRVYDATIDKYLPGWLKDYHIYYGLEQSFGEFIANYNMGAYYPELEDSGDQFELFCSLSKYDIRKSVFYADGNEKLLRDGFTCVMEKLEQAFEDTPVRLEDLLYQPVKNMPRWFPFKGALFYPHGPQRDRKVVLSKREIYVCSQNEWKFQKALTTESGKRFIAYVMKQTEAVLRKAVKYRHKLSAGSNMLSPAMAEELEHAGICLEQLVTRAAMEYYREINKTVVNINSQVLERIRREALMTQEKLTVPEQETKETEPAGGSVSGKETEPAARSISGKETELAAGSISGKETEPAGGNISGKETEPAARSISGNYTDTRESSEEPGKESKEKETLEAESPGSWESFGKELDDTEFRAVAFLVCKQTGDTSFIPEEGRGQWENIKQFADAHGIMPEVLADGINEKAMDLTGDSLFDEEFIIYEDYIDQAKEMVEEIWQRRYLQE